MTSDHYMRCTRCGKPFALPSCIRTLLGPDGATIGVLCDVCAKAFEKFMRGEGGEQETTHAQ
jgi:hypothetical protein